MKLPAYPKYKPSVVEWLGDVPEHWEVKRLRWVGEAIIGLTYSPTDVVSNGEGTLVLRSSNIQGGRIVLDDNVFVSAEIPHKLRTRTNDIVICTRNGSRDLVGKTGKISERESGLTFGAFTAVFRSQANDYMFYVFNSGLFSFQAGLYQTSTIFQLTNGTINAFQIPLPPPAEQRAIASFLDAETGRIDTLIAKKRELVERLKEKRTALISSTVTRGLPAEAAAKAGLPVNPPLKPSGHPWLDDIPKHWEVKRLKEVSVLFGRIGFRGYSTDDLVYEGEGAISMSPSNMAEGVMNLDKCTWLSWEKYHESPEIQVQPEDVIMVKTGSTLGKTAFVHSVPVPMTVNPQLMIFKEVKCSKRFLFYYVFSKVVQDVIPLHNTGSTIPTMTQEGIGKLPFPHPPLPEQAAIASYLDAETAKMDALVSKVEEAVERLQEYRTALITAAVTGKIDVHGVQK